MAPKRESKIRGLYWEYFIKGFEPDPFIDLVEWSNTFRWLPRESSVEPGRYRTSRTPYVEEILRELSPQSPTQIVVFRKPTQIGATEIGQNFVLGCAHKYPGPAMLAFPTDRMAEKHSKKKLAPSIKLMPCLQGIFQAPKSRTSGNTLLLKEFPGGSLTLTGCNSPVAARSDSIRYLVLDDIDGFVAEAGTEGRPGDLLLRRTNAYGRRKKIYKNSTPTITGESPIDDDFEKSSQGLYHVPCPHCKKLQYLIFGNPELSHGIKFKRNDDGEIFEVWYVCEHCHGRIEEHEKTWMLQNGDYIHKFPKRKIRGFTLNSLYSPFGWLSWAEIAEEFLTAARDLKRGDTRGMKTWVNTYMALSWEEKGERADWETLRARVEPYRPLTVPAPAMLLTAGVDVQGDRLIPVIRAWGREEESWLIYYVELIGSPLGAEVWSDLDELLKRPFPHASGIDLYIRSVAIDTGFETQTVYKYCRPRAPVVMAIKGSNTTGKPAVGRPVSVEVTYKGVKSAQSVQLWPVGVDAVKETMMARLNLTEKGPGFYHFYTGLPDEYFKQLTAEKRVTRYDRSNRPEKRWVQVRPQNHVLDAEVYAYAAALRFGVARLHWDSIERTLQGTARADQVRRPVPAGKQGPAKSKYLS